MKRYISCLVLLLFGVMSLSAQKKKNNPMYKDILDQSFFEWQKSKCFELAGGVQSVFMSSVDDEFSVGPQFEFAFKTDVSTKVYRKISKNYGLGFDLNCLWAGDDLEGYSEQNSCIKVSALVSISYTLIN